MPEMQDIILIKISRRSHFRVMERLAVPAAASVCFSFVLFVVPGSGRVIITIEPWGPGAAGINLRSKT
jgi:hypothetical protein